MFRPLYRLDRDTSGALAVGKHRLAASCAQVGKVYYGVAQGELSGSGRIDTPIGLAPGSKIRRQCGEGGQPATTHWQALARGGGFTLLAFRLETGRTHQIRTHMARLGHPLAGDDLYGGARERMGRQALHCGQLELRCPPLGLEAVFCCPFPPDLLQAFPWAAPFSPDLNPL